MAVCGAKARKGSGMGKEGKGREEGKGGDILGR